MMWLKVRVLPTPPRTLSNLGISRFARNGPELAGSTVGLLVSAESDSGVDEVSAELSLALEIPFPGNGDPSGAETRFECDSYGALIRHSVQQFDRGGLKAFSTLADLHPNTLTFGQPAQPGTGQGRRVDEDILAAVILTDKTETLVGLVHLNGTNTFAGSANDLRSSGRAARRGAWTRKI